MVSRIHARRRLCGALLAFAAVVPAAAGAQQARPTIGVALSGGGARGMAHIGVLRRLEELAVPVDVITGTSMGAAIGGLYAAGVSLDELAALLTVELDWNEALSDRTAYRDLAFRRKEDERRYQTGLELGLRRGRLVVPAGVWSGQKLGFLLRAYTLPVAGIRDFARLPIPFRAIAADIESGEAVVLADGDLALAIRASMAIPSVFSPVEIDGRLLVDGGLANNLPVDVARAMGAEVVIAVDVSEPLLDREQLQSLFGVAAQTVSILTRSNMTSRLADADLVITPELDGVGIMAFNRGQEILARGLELTPEARAALQDLALDEAAYRAHRAARNPPRPLDGPLGFVRIEGNRRVDERIVRRRIRSRRGEPLELDAVRDDLARVYALGDFQEVSFAVVEEGGVPGLVLSLIEKPWGPTYLHLGLGLVGDLEGETDLSALVNVTASRLNARGGEWRTDLAVGQRQGVLSELYQPLTFGGALFLAPRAAFAQRLEALFADGEKVAELDLETVTWGLDLGVQLGRHGELRLGALGGTVRSRVKAGVAAVPDVDADVGGLRARLVIDALDSPTIPRRGTFVETELFLSRPGLGAGDSYERLAVRFLRYGSVGRHTVWGGLAGGSNLGSTLPAYDTFLLGGPFALSGYAAGQFRGQLFGLAQLGYQWQLTNLPPGLGRGVYLGVSLEAGEVWEQSAAVGFDDLRWGSLVFARADTVLGPVLAGYGRADGGADRFYFTVGTTF